MRIQKAEGVKKERVIECREARYSAAKQASVPPQEKGLTLGRAFQADGIQVR